MTENCTSHTDHREPLGGRTFVLADDQQKRRYEQQILGVEQAAFGEEALTADALHEQLYVQHSVWVLFVISEDPDLVAGYIYAVPSSSNAHEAYIPRIAISPHVQRRGISQHLHDCLEGELHCMRYSAFGIDASDDNGYATNLLLRYSDKGLNATHHRIGRELLHNRRRLHIHVPFSDASSTTQIAGSS